MKPSQRIRDRSQVLYGLALNRILSVPEPHRRPIDLDTQRYESLQADLSAVLEYLDQAAAPRLVVTEPPNISQAAREKLIEQLQSEGVTILPAGVQRAEQRIAIPCSERLPETPHQGQSERIMFFVPSEPPRWRWRTGRYLESGSGHRHSGDCWQADDTMVGDECHEFALGQVTHWMPLPGEPT
jgi:Protein of unknown function (DUF551)